MLLIVSATLFAPTPSSAQDTTEIASDRQLRQRLVFLGQRFDNLYEELEATQAHLDSALNWIERRIARDSLRDLVQLDSIQIWTDGHHMIHDTIGVGDTLYLAAAYWVDGRIVGCGGYCDRAGVPVDTLGTTSGGTTLVLAGRTGSRPMVAGTQSNTVDFGDPVPVPESVYRNHYREASIMDTHDILSLVLFLLIAGGAVYYFVILPKKDGGGPLGD